MTNSPIYIRKLKIKNIRTLGETFINFENEDGTLPQWTIILGNNGIGKSSILHSIAWMRPFLPYKKDEAPGDQDLKPAPIINDEENDVLISLVRKVPKTYGEGSYIRALFESGRNLGAGKDKKLDLCYTGMNIQLDKNGDLTVVDPVLRAFGKAFYNDEVLVYAYSASRRLGKGNLEGAELVETIPPFIADQTVLYDAQELFHTINYATLGSEDEEKDKYLNFFNLVKKMLISLLPDFKKVADIRITAPKLVKNKLKQAEFLITTKHGAEIPFENFSLGYKTVLSWSVDLAWRLFNKYSESKNPLAEPAIVLVDEIDLHLHPIWQIEIIKNLSTHFPNVQFIATAHSPLIVQSDLKANFAVLKFVEDQVEIVNDPGHIDGWRVDQILTSVYFDLDSARGPEYAKLLKERNYLASKESPTSSDHHKLVEVTKKLADFPSGGTPEEDADRMLIRKILADYKGPKIKL